MYQILNGRVPSRRTVEHKSSTSLVKETNLRRYQHFFGTTTAIVGPDRNLTSVLTLRGVQFLSKTVRQSKVG